MISLRATVQGLGIGYNMIKPFSSVVYHVCWPQIPILVIADVGSFVVCIQFIMDSLSPLIHRKSLQRQSNSLFTQKI